MDSGHGSIDRIESLLRGPADPARLAVAEGGGLALLPALRDRLREDQSIEALESIEAILKAVLKGAMARGCSGEDARRMARFQKELGFLLKYKSYAVKAATPLGYAVFLQNRTEGFSFQRHLTRKTEVFHILSVLPGGFVFLCEYDDWAASYERRAFERWLDGDADSRFDRFRFVPEPGDVFVVSRLGTVHSVIGCVLEEYATVSVDMVQRLHDQNAGRAIPDRFRRPWVEAAIRRIPSPDANRLVDALPAAAPVLRPIPRGQTGWGFRVTLQDSFVKARRGWIEPGAETDPDSDPTRALSLRVVSGKGRFFVGDGSEWPWRASLSIDVEGGDVLMVPPGSGYGLRCVGDEPLEYAEHGVDPWTALAAG